MANAHVDGYSRNRTIEGAAKTVSVTTLRFSTPGRLDVVTTGNGTSNVLQFLKQVAQQIIDLSPENPLPPEWAEIVKIPKAGTEVKISFGIRSEFEEDAE
jgi:hypothetical protein